MANTNSLESLNKISSTVSERDKKIWENEAHSVSIKKATEELDNEIKRMERAAESLQKENAVIEKRLTEIPGSVVVQKQTLKTCENSQLMHKSLKENLIQQRDEMRQKYEKVLQMYEDEYQEYRAIYVNNSKGFKDLRQKEIQLKKLKIAGMVLNRKISNLKHMRKQFFDIQSQILHTTVVKFAKFYKLYHKNEEVQSQLKELKNEEKQLMKQHLELVKLVKEKQQTRKIQERKQSQVVRSAITIEKCKEKERYLRENKDSTSEKLKHFLQEEIKTFSLTTLDSTVQQPEFNKDNSKVKLLEMVVVKPPSFSNQAAIKPDLELRKKMETIMETTRKGALRPDSTRIITPTGSQQSQNEKLSQKSLDKSLTPKENTQINPILKQSKEEPVQNEKSVASKDDNTSKFFNTKKKCVTFQNDSTLKSSQEEKHVRQMENKFTFQTNNTYGENDTERLSKFTFQSDNMSVESEKENQTKGFPFGINKQNVKPVELKSMDIFRKPFTFANELNTKQETKKIDGFMKSSPFGMFGRKLSGEKKADPTPETGISENISSSAIFTGPDSSEKPTSDESCYYDPFQTSFNPNNHTHTPLNITDELEQAPESNTFNFFGSQNKNNLFTMF